MGVLNTVKEVFAASTQNPNRGDDPTRESKGAYWCHDCDQRIPDFEAEGEDPPACPDCGEAMDFERSAGSTGCAC